VTRAGTPKLARLVALAGIAAFLGILLGRGELVALAAPIAVAVALGVAGTQRPTLEVELELDEERCAEGEVVEGRIRLRSDVAIPELDVALVLPAALRPIDGCARVAITLAGGEDRVLPLRLSADRWGGQRAGPIALRAYGPGRLIAFEEVRRLERRLRVYPTTERLAQAIRPHDTQVLSGNHLARTNGDGIEFASVREFVPGDPIRRVNWRVTTRRGVLHVNEQHPERNADVVLFLDTFGDVGPPGRSSLDRTVRGAATLARYELQRKDRVGLVSFGGTVSWLRASSGQTHFLRLVESLLDVNVALSFAWKEIDALPRRALPPLALFVAFSPLIDRRAVRALVDLRARGHSLTIVDTLDELAVRPAAGEAGVVAHRLWRLQREGLRDDLARLGIPVVPWREEGELAAALALVPRAARRLVRA
jgi:uncharacterized protein (DUF58 family)